MDEDHPYNNQNFGGSYSQQQRLCWKIYHFRYGLEHVGLRYMNVYGPRQDYHGAYIVYEDVNMQ